MKCLIFTKQKKLVQNSNTFSSYHNKQTLKKITHSFSILKLSWIKFLIDISLFSKKSWTIKVRLSQSYWNWKKKNSNRKKTWDYHYQLFALGHNKFVIVTHFHSSSEWYSSTTSPAFTSGKSLAHIRISWSEISDIKQKLFEKPLYTGCFHYKII